MEEQIKNPFKTDFYQNLYENNQNKVAEVPVIKPQEPQIKTEPTIKAPNIGTAPVNIPVSKPDTTDYQAILAGATSQAQEIKAQLEAMKTEQDKAKTTTQPEESKNLYEKIKEQITGGTFFGEAPQRTDITGMQAQAGIPEKQQEVNDLTSQLNAINAEAEVGKLRTIGQGRGIPQAILGGQQAQLERERAIRALPIAAQLSAAQGNLQSAQSYVDQALELEKDYQTRLTTYNNNRLDAAWQIATTIEKRELEELKTKNDNEQAEFDRLHDLKNTVMKEAMANGQYNLISSIMGATTEDGITSIASQLQGSVGTDNQIVKLDDGRTMLVDKNTGNMMEIGGGTGGGNEFSIASSKNNVDTISNLINNKFLGKAVGTSSLGRISFFEQFTAGKGTFLGEIDSILSRLSLESLINAKKEGAVFGALSTKEMEILSAAATSLNSPNIMIREESEGEGKGKLLGFKIKEDVFKEKMDIINNFAKLDYILKGGIPEEVGVATMEDGTMWVQNSDGSMTELIRQ